MISDTFIKRPVTAIVISVVIVLVGLIALTVLPIAQYPDITPPVVSISGSFTGADAQTVAQEFTDLGIDELIVQIAAVHDLAAVRSAGECAFCAIRAIAKRHCRCKR